MHSTARNELPRPSFSPFRPAPGRRGGIRSFVLLENLIPFLADLLIELLDVAVNRLGDRLAHFVVEIIEQNLRFARVSRAGAARRVGSSRNRRRLQPVEPLLRLPEISPQVEQDRLACQSERTELW